MANTRPTTKYATPTMSATGSHDGRCDMSCALDGTQPAPINDERGDREDNARDASGVPQSLELRREELRQHADEHCGDLHEDGRPEDRGARPRACAPPRHEEEHARDRHESQANPEEGDHRSPDDTRAARRTQGPAVDHGVGPLNQRWFSGGPECASANQGAQLGARRVVVGGTKVVPARPRASYLFGRLASLFNRDSSARYSRSLMPASRAKLT